MKITFEVLGKPIGKQRPRMTRTGHVYTPKETKDYERLIRNSFNNSKPKDWKVYDGAVYVNIKAFFIRAKSNKMQYCTIKPDIDNIIKSILDGIQGKDNDSVIVDDKQVVGVVVEKHFSIIDRVVVTVESMEVQP